MNIRDDDVLLRAGQVAELLQVDKGTLYAWRYRGVGPPAVNVGRHLRWRRTDIELWLQKDGLR